MSLKVTIGESKTQSEKPFPKLMKSGGVIVLFSQEGEGTVIVDEEDKEKYETGHYSTVWDMNNFTDFNEPITLQND